MFCSKCGKQNQTDSMFCSGCGAKLASGNSNHLHDPNKHVRISAFIMLGLLIAFILVYRYILIEHAYHVYGDSIAMGLIVGFGPLTLFGAIIGFTNKLLDTKHDLITTGALVVLQIIMFFIFNPEDAGVLNGLDGFMLILSIVGIALWGLLGLVASLIGLKIGELIGKVMKQNRH